MSGAGGDNYNRYRNQHHDRGSQNRRRSMIPADKLDALVGKPDCALVRERHSIHVALHPRYLSNLALGLIHHFNELTGSYHPELNGILMGYGKLYLQRPEGAFLNDSAHVHVDVASDFWVFRPAVGATLKGVVGKKSATHVSCLVHGCFTVSCYKPERDEQWMGLRAKLDQSVRVKVVKTDFSQKIPFIMGQMLSLEESDEESEERLVEEVSPAQWEELNSSTSSKKAKKRKRNKDEMDESETPVNGSPKKKKKKKDKDGEAESRMLQTSLLESVEERFSGGKKKKKSKKDKEESEVEVKTEPDTTEIAAASSMDESTASSSSASKKKKKERKSKKTVDLQKEQDAEKTEELQNSLLSAVQSRFAPSPAAATPASASSKKKSRKKSESSVFSRTELQELLRNAEEAPEEKYDPPKPEVNGSALPQEVTPKPAKKSRKKSIATPSVTSTPAVTSTPVEVKVEPSSPKKASPKKRQKKNKPDLDTSNLQDALIQNMLAKLPGGASASPGGRKKK